MQTLAVARPVKRTIFPDKLRKKLPLLLWHLHPEVPTCTETCKNLQLARFWRCICGLSTSFWLSLSFRSRSSWISRQLDGKKHKRPLLHILTQQETSLLPLQVLLSLKGFKSKLHGNQWDIPVCRLLEARPTSQTWIQMTVSNKF